MKTYLSILLGWMVYLSLVNPVLGQNKFSLAITASPNFHYLQSGFKANLPKGPASSRFVDVDYKTNGYGYSVGVVGSYWFSKRLSISTGVFLNSIHLSKPTITTNPDSTASPSDIQFLAIASTVRSLQVPILLNYRVSDKRLSPYFSIGALTSIYSTTAFEESNKSKNTVEKLQPQPTLGAGIDYRLGKGFSLVVQPNLIYFLPYEKVISYKSYQLGLQVQLLCKF